MEEKKLMGYASIDKPWLKYYAEEANMHDLNISYERFLRYSADYVISRRLYDFLTERYPRTHYFPLFLKEAED